MSNDVADVEEAFEHAAISLSLSDVHGRLVRANRAFYDLFGHEAGSLPDVGTLSRDADEEWTLSYLTRLVTGDVESFRTVKRFCRADGSEFDGCMEVRPIQRHGVCVGMIASIHETDLRPTIDHPRLRKLLEYSPGTFTLIDADGTLVETSGRYRSTLGYPAEFWESRTVLDLVVPEDVEAVNELRRQLLESPGRTITADIRVQNVQRGIETLEVTALNMLDDPDLQGVVLATRNVSEERQNMLSLTRLRDEAVAEADERSHLLATVSHELRNPLHAMSGLVELLASDDELGESQTELATSLLRQLRHLTSVTDDLLDASRLEVGRYDLRPSPVVIRDLLDDVVRVGASLAGGRIEVSLAVDDDVPQVITIDPARMHQVVSNLVGNAVKFTEAGWVKVVASVVRDDGQELLQITVADTGVGIPADQIESVFGAFTTATTSGDRRGAGLGLAIVGRLVEAFSGTVSLESTPGQGSVFTVLLPLVIAADAPVADGGSRSALVVRPRVLVVDDTAVNQQLASHQLRRLNIDSMVVGSAEDGIELMSREDFDAVLMDHQLPGMDGREATIAIRSTGDRTPIIGVTASSTAATRQACIDAGMDAFLPKPVGLGELSATLDHIFEMHRGTDAGAGSGSAGESESGAVDVQVLTDLAEELGSFEIVESLVATFLGELSSRREQIAGPDDELASRQAHTLKSSARLLGAGQLADLCDKAEVDPGARLAVADATVDVGAALSAWLAARARDPDDFEAGRAASA